MEEARPIGQLLGERRKQANTTSQTDDFPCLKNSSKQMVLRKFDVWHQHSNGVKLVAIEERELSVFYVLLDFCITLVDDVEHLHYM
jgi:hypothetical protein